MDHISRRARFLEGSVVGMTRELIRIPSFTGNEGTLARYVFGQLEDVGVDLLFQDQVGNVVAMLVGSHDGPTMLLGSHLDTVEPRDCGLWVNDPFSGNLDRKRIYGLGAADAKGGIATHVHAGYLLKNTAPFHGNLIIAATVAHGDGYCAGARHLLEKTLPDLCVKPDLAILGDPTDLVVYSGHGGWVDVDLVVNGEDTRSTQSASDLVCRFLYPPPCDGRVYSSFEGMRVSGPQYRYDGDSAEATIRIRRAVDTKETIQDSVHWVERRVRAAIGDLRGITLAVKIHQESQRFYTGRSATVPHFCEGWAGDDGGGLFDRALDALADVGLRGVRKWAWRPEKIDVGTAGGILTNEHHVPTILFGPGEPEVSGTPDEFVSTGKLVDAVAGTAALVSGLIGAERFGWSLIP